MFVQSEYVMRYNAAVCMHNIKFFYYARKKIIIYSRNFKRMKMIYPYRIFDIKYQETLVYFVVNIIYTQIQP